MNLEEKKAEAKRRGIAPGAVIESPIVGVDTGRKKRMKVPDYRKWKDDGYESDRSMYIESAGCAAPWIVYNGEWATVITPAPSQPTEAPQPTKGRAVSPEALDAMAVLYGRVMASEGYTGGTDIKEYHAKLREAADAMWNAIFPKP